MTDPLSGDKATGNNSFITANTCIDSTAITPGTMTAATAITATSCGTSSGEGAAASHLQPPVPVNAADITTTIDASAINSSTVPLHVVPPTPAVNTNNGSPIVQQQVQSTVMNQHGSAHHLASIHPSGGSGSAVGTGTPIGMPGTPMSMPQPGTPVSLSGTPTNVSFVTTPGQTQPMVTLAQQPVTVSTANGRQTVQHVQVIPQQLATGQPFLSPQYVQQQFVLQPMQPQQMKVFQNQMGATNIVQPGKPTGANQLQAIPQHTDPGSPANLPSTAAGTTPKATNATTSNVVTPATQTTTTPIISTPQGNKILQQRTNGQQQQVVIAAPLVFASNPPNVVGQKGGATPLRLATPHALMTSNGQIINAPQVFNLNQLQAVANLQNQGFSTNQNTIFAQPPIYIRAATPIQPTPGLIGQATPIQPVPAQRNVQKAPVTATQPNARGANQQAKMAQSQTQPTAGPTSGNSAKQVGKTKGQKQQNKLGGKQQSKHSPTEQHMASVAASVGSPPASSPRPPVQLKPKPPVGNVPATSQAQAMAATTGTSVPTPTATAAVLPTVLVAPTVSPGMVVVNANASVAQQQDVCMSSVSEAGNVCIPQATVAPVTAPVKRSDGSIPQPIEIQPAATTISTSMSNTTSGGYINIAPVLPLNSVANNANAIQSVSTSTKSTVTTVPITNNVITQEVAAALTDIKEEPPEKIYKQELPDGLNTVRPPNNNILMHYIEGFVIEEGPEPFPIYRTPLQEKAKKAVGSNADQSQNSVEGIEDMDVTITGQGEQATTGEGQTMSAKKARRRRAAKIPDDAILECEFCHQMDVARKFRRSKRFCSVPCAKRYNVGCSRRVMPVHLLANYVGGKGDAALLRCEMCHKEGIGSKFRSFRRFCSWTCVRSYKKSQPQGLLRAKKSKNKSKNKAEEEGEQTAADGMATAVVETQEATNVAMETGDDQVSVTASNGGGTVGAGMDVGVIEGVSVSVKASSAGASSQQPTTSTTITATASGSTAEQEPSSMDDDEGDFLTCEACGKQGDCESFDHTLRYCSDACTKLGNVQARQAARENVKQHKLSGEKGTKLKSKHKAKKKKKLHSERHKSPSHLQSPSKSSTPARDNSGHESRTSDDKPLHTLINSYDLQQSDATGSSSSPSVSAPAVNPQSSSSPHTEDDIDDSRSSVPQSPVSHPSTVSQPSASSQDDSQDDSSTYSSPPRSPPVLERAVSPIEGHPASSQYRDDDGDAPAADYTTKAPSQWTVQDTYQFISELPGCGMYADSFASQEIDGDALMLLKEDHLMQTMNMKLGPALKICARIVQLKEEFNE